MSDDQTQDRLSPGQLAYLASKVSEGCADPEEARQLLAEFVACVRAGETISDRLLEYLCDAFESYLSESEALLAVAPPERLGRALGLVRATAGNPGTDERRALRIARSILLSRLAGASAQDAIEHAMDKWQCGRTTATDAWRERKRDALLQIRVGLAVANQEWTQDELRRLAHIYRNDLNAIPETLRLPAG